MREAYPDSTALDSKSPKFDPKSHPEKPIWFMVDVKLVAPTPQHCIGIIAKCTHGIEHKTYQGPDMAQTAVSRRVYTEGGECKSIVYEL